MYDLRLKTPFTYIAAGASQSGKSTHVFNILKNTEELFTSKPATIIYYYNQWQEGFERFNLENPGVITKWVQHMPSLIELKEETEPYKNIGGSVVIIDDFASQLNNDIGDLFTVLCHANNINVFLLTQNIFQKNPVFRVISLNATYISIFKNPRDSSQIQSYARQFSPSNTKYIVEAYKDCTKKAYSYIQFDHHQSTPDLIRVRSNFLPHEHPIKVYNTVNTCI
jgi:hypothetical protein